MPTNIKKYDWVSNNTKLNANGWSVPLRILILVPHFAATFGEMTQLASKPQIQAILFMANGVHFQESVCLPRLNIARHLFIRTLCTLSSCTDACQKWRISCFAPSLPLLSRPVWIMQHRRCWWSHYASQRLGQQIAMTSEKGSRIP